jgi:hypothetical protein
MTLKRFQIDSIIGEFAHIGEDSENRDAKSLGTMSLEHIIAVIRREGYIVTKADRHADAFLQYGSSKSLQIVGRTIGKPCDFRVALANDGDEPRLVGIIHEESLRDSLRRAGELIPVKESHKNRPLTLGHRLESLPAKIEVEAAIKSDKVENPEIVGTLDEALVIRWLRDNAGDTYTITEGRHVGFENPVRHAEFGHVQHVDEFTGIVLIANTAGQTIAKIDLAELMEKLDREGIEVRPTIPGKPPIPIGSHVRTPIGDVGIVANTRTDAKTYETIYVVHVTSPVTGHTQPRKYHRDQLTVVRRVESWEDAE